MNRFSFSTLRFAALAIACGLCLTTAVHAQSFWIGQGATAEWSDAGNWDGYPFGTPDVVFAEINAQTTNHNDFAPGLHVNSLTFNNTADPFTLQGAPVDFFTGAGTITNNSSNLQTLDFSSPIIADVDLMITAASGDIQINNGIRLENFAGSGGNLIVDGDFNTTISGDITQSALRSSVTKNGSGALQLDGSNEYTGGTTINDGTLIVNNLNALGVQEQNPFALLHNDVTLNGGTLQTLEGSPRTFNVPDNYVQNGGTLRVQIGSDTTGVNNDLMQVGRNANLDANGDTTELFIHRISNFNPVPGDTVTIITTNNGSVVDFPPQSPGVVVNQFDVVNTDFPGLIQPTVEYFDQRVDVVFELTASFASQGLTRNQICVGENLDAAVDFVNTNDAAHNLIGIIGSLPPEELPDAFDLLAPEEFASMYEISFQHGIMEVSTYRQRMDDLRASARGYCEDAAPQPMAMAPDGKMVMDGKDKNVVPVETCPDKRWGMFATGYGQGVNVDDDEFNNVHGYDIMTGGFSTGFDALVTHNIAIGIGGGYAQSTADLVNDGRVDVETGYVAAYATAFFGGFYVDGVASGGWSTYDTSRLGFDGFENGNTEGAEFNGSIGAGYDWRTHCWTIGPFATFHYTYVEFDSFDEDGGSIAPLHFPDQNQDAERGAIGLKVAYDMTKGNIIFRPELRAAFQHEFNNTDYAIDWSFRDIPDDHICDVFGPSTGRDSALIDAGFSLVLGKCHNVSVFAFYSGNIGRDNDTRHGANGGLRLSF